MKNIIICWVFFLIINVGYAQDIDKFRGIKWGEDIKNLDGFILISESKEFKIYSKKEENKIGNADVEFIFYHFYKDKFCGASIGFNGYNNFNFLKKVLFEKYGKGSKQNPYIEKYNWFLGDVWIILNYSDVQKKGRIYYYFKPLMNQMKKEEAEDAKKAKDEL